MQPLKLALAAAAVLVLAGCSSPAPASAPTSKPFTTHLGQSAATIASHVKACKNVQAGSVGSGAPALVSTATCTIEGHKVNFNSWKTTDDVASVNAVYTTDELEAYYTAGTGWTATVGDDPTVQMQLTNDAGGLLESSLAGAVPTSEDLDGQMTVSSMIRESIEGQTLHTVGS